MSNPESFPCWSFGVRYETLGRRRRLAIKNLLKKHGCWLGEAHIPARRTVNKREINAWWVDARHKGVGANRALEIKVRSALAKKGLIQ